MTSGDYTLTPSGNLGGKVSVGIIDDKFIGEFGDGEDALQAVSENMEREQFWPDIWWVSDHGNCWQIDIDVNEII